MDTLQKSKQARDALPVTQQKELLRRLAERLRGQEKPQTQLPLVAPTETPSRKKRLTMPRFRVRRCWTSMWSLRLFSPTTLIICKPDISSIA